MNKTSILFILSLTIVIIQWVIFDVLWTIAIIFIVIIWFKIFFDKWFKNYIRDIKSFILNDDNFVSVMIIFYFIFWVYAIDNIGKENIIFTVVWYLVMAWCLHMFIDDKKQKEIKIEKDIENFKGSLDEYVIENDLDDENDFWNTPIKNLLSDDEYKDFEESMNEAKENIDEMLELDEEKKDSLLSDMVSKVLNKEYNTIIDFNDGQLLQKYLVNTNNVDDLSEYYLLVWASYQEVWNLELAGKCFDIFLDNLSLDSNIIQVFEKQDISDIGVIKLMLLMKRLQDLWLEYKMNKEEYDKTTKPNKKKKKKAKK